MANNVIPDETIADLVQQHLYHDNNSEDAEGTTNTTVSSGSGHNNADSCSTTIEPPNDAEISVSYHLPGAAITHDIYAHANSLVMASHSLNRSKSFNDIKQKAGKLIHDDETPGSSDYDSTDEFENLDKPGGFRRFHIKQQHRLANELQPEQVIQPENAFQELFRPDSVCSGDQDYTTGLYKLDSYQPTNRTRHFLEYLAMTNVISQFAGEDLSDSEEDSPDDEEQQQQQQQQVSETTSLLPNNRRKRRHSAILKKKEHKANVTKTVFLLFKAFIGSGILFLPKAFSNGGLVFSIITMWAMGGISLYCFLLLLDCKKYLTGSYGDMGGQLYGSWMRSIVLFSIAISQVQTTFW